MFYREAGQYNTTYEQDLQAFPIKQDKIGIAIWLVLAYLFVPFFGIPGLEYGFAMNAIMIPVLIFTITTIGLNILVGFTGQISLGTGAFMGVGAYACYKLTSYFPDTNIIILILASGFVSAIVGALFGLPSLRIKGFYLVVATLAAQFFLEWCFIRVDWLYNYNPSGAIEVPQREVLGWIVTGPSAEPMTRYLVVLSILVFLAVIAGNLTRIHHRVVYGSSVYLDLPDYPERAWKKLVWHQCTRDGKRQPGGYRCDDRCDFDCRAARNGPFVADREAEIKNLAVPALGSVPRWASSQTRPCCWQKERSHSRVASLGTHTREKCRC